MEFTKEEFWKMIDNKEMDLLTGNKVKYNGETYNIGIQSNTVVLLKGK